MRWRITGSVVAAVAVLLLSGYVPALATPAPTGSWHLVFNDRFTRFRAGKWALNWLGRKGKVTKPPDWYEQAAMSPHQARFTRAGLELTPHWKPWTAPDGASFPFRSGDITGYQKQGYMPPLMAAARLYLPCDSAGKIENWPSFWLVGNPYQWPQDGEIDVVEGLDGSAMYHLHYLANGTAQGPGAVAQGDWCGWHTFRVIWHSDGSVDWQYDSNWVGHLTGYPATAAEFPVLMYSMAKPGTYPQCPAMCSGPRRTGVHMRARWLRIWRWW